MLKLNLRKFLLSAVEDPRDKKNPLLQMILEQGTPQLFELKAQEYLEEASRLRQRYLVSNDTTLLELYNEKLRKAATFVSFAAETINEHARSSTRVQHPGSEASGGQVS